MGATLVSMLLCVVVLALGMQRLRRRRNAWHTRNHVPVSLTSSTCTFEASAESPSVIKAGKATAEFGAFANEETPMLKLETASAAGIVPIEATDGMRPASMWPTQQEQTAAPMKHTAIAFVGNLDYRLRGAMQQSRLQTPPSHSSSKATM
eukprot:CAMPEP_0119328702 /NCGR_PEP_ID=MMETSP1333-20130426/74044_1 /TAXON_ID=418940 /ORGANISM="Scyphosphaera apsteinii, Strain RCC1455" /LENGTH=149 /DNA_ID=CAMNT_0007337635 /DNA_START=12 /DNA_END=461 /DNA_ORIENTATION=+